MKAILVLTLLSVLLACAVAFLPRAQYRKRQASVWYPNYDEEEEADRYYYVQSPAVWDEEEQADAEFFALLRRLLAKRKQKQQQEQPQPAPEEEETDGPTTRKVKFIRRDFEEEETDRFSKWLGKGQRILDLLRERRDFAEESDIQILDKFKEWIQNARKWVRSKFGKNSKNNSTTPVTAKGDDAEVASDSEITDCGVAYVSGQPQGRKTCTTIDGKMVVVETANAFNTMKAAAAKDGITLKINSGFRTQAEQERLYNCYLTKKCNNGNLAARPGYSNHQNGIALDINVPSNVFSWLSKNASKYGFVRTVPSENWHWELRRGAKCNQFVKYSCN